MSRLLVLQPQVGAPPEADEGHLASQVQELRLQPLVQGLTPLTEASLGAGHRDHQRDGETSEGPDHELHGVYGLQPLHSARRADEPNNLLGEVGGLRCCSSSSQSSAFLNDPLIVPWYRGLLQMRPSAA
jgi:hypothetical protein